MHNATTPSHLLHSIALDTFVPMLGTLSTLLDKGIDHAKTKGFEPAVLVTARLAPDMLPLSTQVQIACDQAKNGVARLMGKEAPRFEDNETTMEDLKARIASTIAYLKECSVASFDGAPERDIKFSMARNRRLEMKGTQYLRDWVLPQFYFHLVTAYDILRHNGVTIGKRDYIAHTASSVHEDAAA